MPTSPGKSLGPYEILSPLGAGGMGEVFRARDTRLARDVAIKILPSEFASSQERLTRFEQEARSASALNHPNIITVYDIGSFNSTSYIAMELVEGKSLRELLSEGPLPIRKIVNIASQLADGLAKAHAAGIIHRDLKPENIMISKDGFLKILDFGLAKLSASPTEKASTLQTQTGAGMVLGTVGYMSPEQASGGQIDFRSDQFSFGSILYEMIAGKRAFQKSTPAETMVAIMREESESLLSLKPQTPAPLRWIVDRCLAKDPDDRYASTRDLARELQSLRDHISELTSSVESVAIAPPTAKRSRFLTPLVALLTFLAGAAISYWVMQPKPQEPIKFLPLTFSGKDYSPAVSPDGKLIAFRSDRDGTPRIWLKQLAGGNEVVMTSGPDDYPRFSPDGTGILFIRTQGTTGSVYRIPVFGGEERKLLDDVASADWSPDGEKITFVRWKGGDSLLNVASVDGTDMQELATIPKKLMEFPRWSPDGKRISAVEKVQGNLTNTESILILDVASRKQQWTRATWPTAAIWSGSGNQILYGTSKGGALSALVTNIRISGTAVLQNVSSQKILPVFWATSIGDILDIVGNGRIVLHSSSLRSNLRQVNISGNSNSTDNRWLTRGNSADRQPVYSPDGLHVLFTSKGSDNLDLWELTTATGAIKRITDDAADDWDPSYSHDGKQILWSSTRGGHFEAWMANADGSGAHQLTQDGRDGENPVMTPDKSWIIYNSYNPSKLGIWKIRPDGSAATQLVSGVTQWPEISPDGRYIAYNGYEHSQVSDEFGYIRAVEIATGKTVQFQIKARNAPLLIGGRERWMPNGLAIAYVDQNEKGAWGVFLQDFIPGKDTYNTRKALAGFDPDKPTETFGISPDGSRITITELDVLSSLVLVENVPGVTRPSQR